MTFNDPQGNPVIDLDYILEWLCPAPNAFAFRVAPATLTFLEVFALRIEIDYASATAGITPFSIGVIKRQEGECGMPPNWTIELNWPNGAISFSAKGFRQVLRATPIVSESQGLDARQRTSPGG